MPNLFCELQFQVYYTWLDKPYQQFMQNILYNLEPVKYNQFFTIALETEEFGQVTFIQNGTVKIGFELMKTQHFVLKKEHSCVVGAYGLSFNQRSKFIFRIFSKQATGYFIRRENWQSILSDKPEIAIIWLQNIIFDYVLNLRIKIFNARKLLIKKFEKRNDHNILLMNQSKECVSKQMIY